MMSLGMPLHGNRLLSVQISPVSLMPRFDPNWFTIGCILVTNDPNLVHLMLRELETARIVSYLKTSDTS